MEAGIPIPLGTLPSPSPAEKAGSRAAPYSEAEVSFLVFGSAAAGAAEVEMSFVPSGQFLHLPSPSYSHFEVKVLVVSKAISFLFLQTQMCFLACGVRRVSTHL